MLVFILMALPLYGSTAAASPAWLDHFHREFGRLPWIQDVKVSPADRMEIRFDPESRATELRHFLTSMAELWARDGSAAAASYARQAAVRINGPGFYVLPPSKGKSLIFHPSAVGAEDLLDAFMRFLGEREAEVRDRFADPLFSYFGNYRHYSVWPDLSVQTQGTVKRLEETNEDWLEPLRIYYALAIAEEIAHGLQLMELLKQIQRGHDDDRTDISAALRENEELRPRAAGRDRAELDSARREMDVYAFLIETFGSARVPEMFLYNYFRDRLAVEEHFARNRYVIRKVMPKFDDPRLLWSTFDWRNDPLYGQIAALPCGQSLVELPVESR